MLVAFFLLDEVELLSLSCNIVAEPTRANVPASLFDACQIADVKLRRCLAGHLNATMGVCSSHRNILPWRR
jgi:hypothetical protein